MTARPTAPDSTSETTPDVPDAAAVPDVAAELALEQAHVDRVYAELEKASRRAADVEADGLARGRTSRTGDVRDEEMTGLFERDALVYAAARRRSMIDKQYEGLVFGRLDLGTEQSTAAEREVRYIGRSSSTGAPPRHPPSTAPPPSTRWASCAGACCAAPAPRWSAPRTTSWCPPPPTTSSSSVTVPSWRP